mgnify:CR=1 FL=1
MAKKLSRSRIVLKLDTVFSKYIRLSNADKNGYCSCFTCGANAYWKNDGLDAGHFMSRKHYSTRWDERNVSAQCHYCNTHKYGEQYKFGVFLNSKFGESTASKLHTKAQKQVKYETYELIEMIEKYQHLFDKLK